MHGQGEPNRPQLCGDVFSRLTHFAGVREDIKHDEQCQVFEKTDSVFHILLPNQFAW